EAGPSPATPPTAATSTTTSTSPSTRARGLTLRSGSRLDQAALVARSGPVGGAVEPARCPAHGDGGTALGSDRPCAAHRSRLAGDAAVRRDLVRRFEGRGVWTPLRDRHHAWFEQVEAVEEPGELCRAAEDVGNRTTGVVAPVCLHPRGVDVGAVAEHEVAAG